MSFSMGRQACVWLRTFVLAAIFAAPQGMVAAETPSFSDFLAASFQRPDGVYIVDGDLPIKDIDELYRYYLEVVAHVPQTETSETSTGGTSSEPILTPQLAILNTGSDVKWTDSQKLNLTYCISNQFGTDRYGGPKSTHVKVAMDSAVESWEGAAYVNFIDRTSVGVNCENNSNVLFRVVPYFGAINDTLLAAAFFPNYPASQRNLYINTFAIPDPGFGLTLSGLLRHELGHILGFVHEHTRPEAGGVCFEGTQYRPLTDYDRASVMHYRSSCNGLFGDYFLTSRDKSGVQSIYGSEPPPPATPTNRPPVANVAAPQYVALVGQTIVFDGTGSYDPDGQLLTYKWNFGDGQTATVAGVPVVGHAYNRAGSYTVSLVVNDGTLDSTVKSTTAIIQDITWLIPIIDLLLE